MESVKASLTSDDFLNLLQETWPPPDEILSACKKDAMAVIIWAVKNTERQTKMLLEAAKARYPNEKVCIEHGHLTMGYVP